MKRFYQSLSLLSLALCVAVLGDWATHYYRGTRIIHGVTGVVSPGPFIPCSRITTGGGIVQFTWYSQHGAITQFRNAGWVIESLDKKTDLRIGTVWPATWGFERFHLAKPANVIFKTTDIYGLNLPSWFVAVLLAILPSASFIGRLKSRSIPAGHCKQCGYDLRATPERCPECGAVARPLAEGLATGSGIDLGKNAQP